MSNREFESCIESSTGGHPGAGGDPSSALLQLIGKAVLGAMLEDWTSESLALYREAGQGLPVRGLPNDSISAGSAMERQLMQQLAGGAYPLEELSDIVRDFLVLVVSGARVLEDETALCQVVWVSRGEVADPVFVLADGF